MELYVVMGSAIKDRLLRRVMTTTLAKNDAEAMGIAHTLIRQQCPASDGYGQYDAMVQCIERQRAYSNGYTVTVTIEPAVD